MKETKNSPSKSWQNRALRYIKQFRDVRIFGLHVFVAIALLVSWSGVGIIQRNYKLQQQISRLEQENELQRLENETLKLRNEYYNTEQYLELTARQQFGQAAPGEKVLLISEEVAIRRTVDPEPENESSPARKSEKPTYQRNFEAWMEFLFRQST